LVPDTPVVTWWHGLLPAVPSAQPLGLLAQRRITDAARAKAPIEALAALSAGYKPGDTDLSWTRATPWRSLLAATVDQEPFPIIGGIVAAEEHNPTADLLTAWLSSRLGVRFSREISDGPGITEVRMQTTGGDVVISRPDGRVATLTRPGQPDRRVALQRREIADLLAEELRRLDPDEIYGEALAYVAGIPATTG
jgi:glucose-6-phosphate dehydrogenase assembly protein OpcA